MKTKARKWLKYIGIGVVTLSAVAFWLIMGYIAITPGTHPCNVGIVKMYGVLDYVDDPAQNTISVDPIVDEIDRLSGDENIKAIVLEIYSPGGIPTAGEAVAKALKRSPKRTIALVKEDTLSAAYLAATGADKIYASKMAQVGSIGVTMSYLDSSGKNAQDGMKFIQISSAPFKDMYNDEKPITAAERQKMQDTVDEAHRALVQEIAENRHMPVDAVSRLADGSAYMSEDAAKSGLIDAVGGFQRIVEDLAGEGIKASMCGQQ